MLEIDIEGEGFLDAMQKKVEERPATNSHTFKQRIEFPVVFLSYPEHDAEDGEGVLGTVAFADGTGDVLSVFGVEVHQVELRE